MKTLPWRRILAILAVCLVIAGFYPLAGCLWLAFGPRPQPFILQFPPTKGEYTSSPIQTGFGGPYRIDLAWPGSVPADKQIWLDLDWKTVDQKGGIVKHGSYHDWIAGNTICLAGYAEGYRKGERVVATLPHDVHGLDNPMRLKVSVDQDEIGLDLSYGWGISIIEAGIVAGPGVLLLIALIVWRARSRSKSPTTL